MKWETVVGGWETVMGVQRKIHLKSFSFS